MKSQCSASESLVNECPCLPFRLSSPILLCCALPLSCPPIPSHSPLTSLLALPISPLIFLVVLFLLSASYYLSTSLLSPHTTLTSLAFALFHSLCSCIYIPLIDAIIIRSSSVPHPLFCQRHSTAVSQLLSALPLTRFLSLPLSLPLLSLSPSLYYRSVPLPLSCRTLLSP